MARGFSETLTLVNAPVMLQEEPSAHGPGVRFLCDVYRVRIRDIAEADGLIEQADLERLAYFSGGRGRDFVRLIQALMIKGFDEEAPRATAELVDEVIDAARRRMEEGLYREDFELVARIARDPRHELPNDPRTNDLLRYFRLLPYSNGSEWFYPHPLLTLSKVRVSPAGSDR
ncbi:hypothetical protein BE04_01340 [Sorangium cellulosum]|uniref:Uncharacterized protein n=2 Tax=Sorangium cellulosum TaxID=56 RepID=A0A150PIT3_SORCE|nr:hypothetical protein [Sorangium cellulosum]AGP36725.1 hypothetical protein SCE1572_20850 [Sorangium cellulosum So0157-2]KYF55607.1 hypothetical protein BE04_01340 [Sorangium cellulosum]